MPTQREEQEREQLFPKQSYVGNVWGWKISFISLGIILFFMGLMFYKHKYGGGLDEDARIELFPSTHHHQKADSLKNSK